MSLWDPARTALVCLDFQVEILRGEALGPSTAEARDRLDRAVENARHALTWARQLGVHIAHVRHAHAPGYPEASAHVPMTRFMRSRGVLVLGQPGTAFDERVAPLEGEQVVTKQTISALTATSLDRQLRVLGVETVVLCGVVTHFVVEGTARQAVDLGYRTVVITDASASANPNRHDMSLKNLSFLAELTTLAELTQTSDQP